jgi:hypothetical protein
VQRPFSFEPTSALSLRFAVWSQDPPESGTHDIASIELARQGDDVYAIELKHVGRTGLLVEEDVPRAGGGIDEQRYDVGAELEPGRWRQVEIVLSRGAPSWNLKVNVDGTIEIDQPLSRLHDFVAAPSLRLGEDSTSARPQRTICCDNVVFDIQ